MKKFLGSLVLSSLVLTSVVQARHMEEVKAENCAMKGDGKACAYTPGPQVGGECLGGEVLPGCTIPGETRTVTYTCPDVQCPNMTCPTVTCPIKQCPSCPVCPQYEVKTELVEICPEKCPTKCGVKKSCSRCHRCTRCHSRCTSGRCPNHGKRGHGVKYATYEAEEIAAPATEEVMVVE